MAKKTTAISAVQAEILLDQVQDLNNPKYNVGGFIRLGPVDIERISHAHEVLIETNDVFGARINMDGLEQYFSHERTLTLPLVDFSTSSDPIAAAWAYVDTLFEKPFVFFDAELFRARLLKISAREFWYLGQAHHICLDGWGFANWAKRLSHLYDGFDMGNTSNSVTQQPTLPRERKPNNGRVLAEQTYWQEILTGLPEPLLLGRPARRSGRWTHALSELQHSNVLTLAARLNASNADIYSAVVLAYLFVAYEQSDLLLGVPVHNRTTAALKEVLGSFADVSVLRVQVNGGDMFGDLVAKIRTAQMRNLKSQRLPLAQHLRDAGIGRTDGPIYQVAFNYVQLAASLPLGETEGRLVYCTSHHQSTPLSINICEYGKGLAPELQLDYNLGFFSDAEIALVAGRLGHILDNLLAIHDVPLRQVDVLPKPEMDKLGVWQNLFSSSTDTAYCLHELFEEQVRQQPDRIALVFGSECFSYRDLNRRANRLARYLLQQGVQPDTRVAICTERNLDMIVAILGTLKAGGAYVPLDPIYPTERLVYILDDCVPVVILTESKLQPKFEGGVPVVCMDTSEVIATLEEQTDDDLAVTRLGLTPSNLAYVVYTSGSTGTPKGVLVEHQHVVRLFHTTNEQFRFSSQDTWSLFHSFAFDFSVWEMWGAFVYGGKAVIVSAECARSSADFYDLVCRENITILNQTPSAFKQFQAAQTERKHALRCVVFGGEALDPRTLMPWVRRNGIDTPQLINMYGITETTIHVTYHQITHHDLHEASSLIGKPLNDLTVSILNANLRLAPIGVVGEIYVGGAGVARGYLNRPELTATRFLSDPFGNAANVRLYKSGDLARWLPNGNIEYLGRNDAQVKIRGFRIELGEIESKLIAIPGVRGALAVVREDSPGEKRLVAYLVLDDVALSPAKLRAALAPTLPEYMLPTAFVTVEAFALTPNGKLDHKALPPPGNQSIASRSYDTPRGRIEIVLAEIWRELLDLERVGRNDHFFEIGGHSLMAVQVASRLREALGVDIALHDLFARPVLSELAAMAECASPAVVPALLVVDRQRPIPVSLIQQRLWFLAQLDPLASAAYHMPAALQMTGRLEHTALCAAFDRIVARHEILRTTFSGASGEVVQCIAAPEEGFAMRFHDLRAVPSQAQYALVKQIGMEESSMPFDLETGPLMRGKLVQLGDKEHILFITLHHIIADGWSIGLLLKELGTVYRLHTQGSSAPLPPLPLQYADFAAWQRRSLHENSLVRQAQYWREQMRGAPALLQLPTDRPRPPRQSFLGAAVKVRLDASQTDALLRLGQRHDATLFMALLSSWALLLTRLSGQDDVVIGTPTANRRSMEVEGIVGPFVNMLPLRVRLDHQLTVAQLISQVRLTSLQAHEHQDLPFEQIVDAVAVERHPSYGPLFQSALLLDNTPTEGLNLPGLTLSPWEPVFVGAKQDLSLHVVEIGGCLDCTLVYSTSLFDNATAEAFLQYWTGFVSAMCQNDQAASSALCANALKQLDVASLPHHPVVSASSFVTFSQEETEQTIGERFVAQVQRHRNEAAVISSDRMLTYGELYGMAQQVACSLSAGDSAADHLPVGLLLSHGEDMIVGILGALLAGRCYVPLDPEYPQLRLAFMVRDSGMNHVITSAKYLPLAGRIISPSTKVVSLESALAATDPVCQTDAWQPRATPDSVAYILYTSGSTGQPKGIVQTNRNALYFCSAYTNNLAIVPSDRVALLASFSFDAAVMDLFGALLNGACLVPIHPKALDARRLTAYLAEKRTTIYHSTPTLYRHLFGSCSELRLPDVRLVVLGGELVNRTDLDTYVAAFSDECIFVNGYGPSESTLALQRFLNKEMVQRHGTISAGHPIAGTTIALGAADAPLTLFQTGEIFIRSNYVALKYHAQPELTASAFGITPDGVRYYRTGDIGRVLADGSLQILGRADNQIKMRGMRLEPGEIEAQLKRLPGVHDSVVVLREDQPGDQRLVAYVIADDRWDQSEAVEQLTRTLPTPMIPSSFLLLEQFPLTPSGKIDRRALPQPVAPVCVAPTPPRTHTETRLARIWQARMQRDSVGVTDNFFALGGDSLLLMQMLTCVNQEFALNLSLSSAMQLQTIEKLANAIDDLLNQQAAHQRIAMGTRPQAGIRI